MNVTKFHQTSKSNPQKRSNLLSHAKGRQNFEAAESKGASQSQHNEETKPFYPPQSQIGLQEQAICSKSLKIWLLLLSWSQLTLPIVCFQSTSKGEFPKPMSVCDKVWTNKAVKQVWSFKLQFSHNFEILKHVKYVCG